MPKKVSEIQRKEIIDSFLNGLNIKEISISFDFSISTITRQLKNALGEKKFKEIKKSKLKSSKINLPFKYSDEFKDNINSEQFNELDRDNYSSEFIELEPLIDVVEIDKQKDLSSKPLKHIKFPKMVYLLVDKEIELNTKLLNEYPEWRFLPNEDQNRNTIEIFAEQKEAKIKCNKNQKLLKVPNPNVFLLASRNLKKKGITRIIFGDLLIAI